MISTRWARLLGVPVVSVGLLGGALDAGLKVRTMHLPDVFQDQDSPVAMYDTAGLNAEHIAARAMAALGVEAGVSRVRA